MTETIENYTLLSEYGIPSIDAGTFERLARTLLLIVAAKGSIAPTEWAAFMDLGRRLGSNPEIKARIEAFDFKNAKIEEQIPKDASTPIKRILVFEAIRICNADGEFHEAERAAVLKAADGLGVSRASVIALEAIASAEAALLSARIKLFHQG
jgi:uncharacterized tellurite resistance protein B-like protein